MKKVLLILVCVSLVSLAQADLIITNGTFDNGTSGALDVPDWYDSDGPDWWNTASICAGPNPFPDNSCMLGDSWPAEGGGRWIYQAIGTKESCRDYTISIDYAQPTDGSPARSPWIQVDIYQGSFPGAADDVDIAEAGLTLICTVISESFPDMDIHNLTSPLDLSSANGAEMLWIRITNLEGQTAPDAWVVVDNIQITSEEAPCGAATNPNPSDEEDDVYYKTLLSWTPGMDDAIESHNLYLGTDYNNVSEADIDDIVDANVLAVNLDVNSFDPGKFDFGTTYYWRIDEVNNSSNPGVKKGYVWSFTVEPLALKLPYELITVNASNSIPNNDPNETINESGLDPNHPDEHYASIGLWAGDKVDGNNVWIQYDFDKKYKLHEMLVWNYNQSLNKRYGFKDVLIEYSEDGETWSVLPDANYFEIATGKPAYVYNTVVPFDAVAKSVRITALSNHNGKYYGLAEVRFMYIPVRARIQSPLDGANDTALEATLKWRNGREVDTHTVYIGTDKDAVTDGTAPSYSVNINNYTLDLDIGQTYYWRVDEVNNSMIPSIWESDVWSFSTPSSILIEGFETGYDDSDENAVWATWKDGFYDTANGSVMGNETGTPYLSAVRHSGGYSSPMSYYNDSANYSEVTADVLDLPIGTKDWTTGNPEALVIWFLGDVNNAPTDKLYVKLNGQKVEYNGDDTDISRQSWVKWEIALSEFGINVNNISTISIGLEKTGAQGGSGIIYLDDIQLTLSVEAVDPGTDNLVAKYDMENNVLDGSGNLMDGTVFGDPTYEEGKYGMAMVFDGNDDYVTLPIGQTMSTMTSCTISTWVNWSGGDSWQRIFDFGRGTANNMWLSPRSSAAMMRFAIKADDGAESQANATPRLPEGTWEHLACVIDAEKMTMTLYINGGPIATNKNLQYLPMDMGVTTQNRLGRSQYPADPYFSGMIDDFRIYDRALSEGEIQYIYKN